MPNYSKGKIYTIRCHADDSLIYVGSTTQELYRRFYQHKVDSKRHPDILLYKTINNNWDNWYYELYQKYPCSCKEELLRREGEVIRQIATLNKIIAGRTSSEYYIDNREQIAEQQKQYYQANREQIAEQQKQHYQANREHKVEYSKEYNQANREQIAEYKKQYRQANRDKINEQSRQRYQSNKNKKIVQSIIDDILDDVVDKLESKNSILDQDNL